MDCTHSCIILSFNGLALLCHCSLVRFSIASIPVSGISLSKLTICFDKHQSFLVTGNYINFVLAFWGLTHCVKYIGPTVSIIEVYSFVKNGLSSFDIFTTKKDYFRNQNTIDHGHDPRIVIFNLTRSFKQLDKILACKPYCCLILDLPSMCLAGYATTENVWQ